MSSIEPPSLTPLLEAFSTETTYAGVTVLFVILIILIALSALASGSEAAFFSLNPTQKEELKAENTKNSNLVLELLSVPKELLATILITNNFVNVGIVIISSAILGEVYPKENANETLRFIVEVVGITLVLLLLGDWVTLFSSELRRVRAGSLAGRVASRSRLVTFSRYETAPRSGLARRDISRRDVSEISPEISIENSQKAARDQGKGAV